MSKSEVAGLRQLIRAKNLGLTTMRTPAQRTAAIKALDTITFEVFSEAEEVTMTFAASGRLVRTSIRDGALDRLGRDGVTRALITTAHRGEETIRETLSSIGEAS